MKGRAVILMAVGFALAWMALVLFFDRGEDSRRQKRVRARRDKITVLLKEAARLESSLQIEVDNEVSKEYFNKVMRIISLEHEVSNLTTENVVEDLVRYDYVDHTDILMIILIVMMAAIYELNSKKIKL